jgi:hypothetical protein
MKEFLSSKTPILISTGFSFLFSVYLWFFVSKESGVFVAIWVPSILAFGIFMRNK